VVSVELLESCRSIVQSWWEQTNQKGNLIQIADVQEVTAERLAQWIGSFGGFDLVICGLEGEGGKHLLCSLITSAF